MSFSTMTQASELALAVETQIHEKIMAQLNWFISRGLIEVKRGEAIFTSEVDRVTGKYVVRYSSTAELVLKDKEYIEKLENENKTMKDLIMKIRESI